MRGRRLIVAALAAAVALPARFVAQMTSAPPSPDGFGGSAGSGSDYGASSQTGAWTGAGTASPSSSSASGRSDDAGDAGGSYGDWWMPDGPDTSSSEWETRPLTWMGEFDPQWTDNMPYPALGTVFRPTYAGQKALRPPRKFRFNDSARVAPLTLSPIMRRGHGECPRRLCLNISIRSDYGALTDFEAFVMDRFESKTQLEADAFDLKRPMVLIRGQISYDELVTVFGDRGSDSGSYGSYSGSYSSNSGSYWSSGGSYGNSSGSYGNDSGSYWSNSGSYGSGSDGSESNEGWGAMWDEELNLAMNSTTNWLMYPHDDHDADEIDVTMSFKQLYTMLPGYDANAAMLDSSGPFYSDDPNDQVVLHLMGHRESEYSSSSSLFPLVMKSNGSTLFDVEYTSYPSYDSRVVNVDISFKRKRYGAIPPWIPGEPMKCEMMEWPHAPGFWECLSEYFPDSLFHRLFVDAAGDWEHAASLSVSEGVHVCFGWGYLQRASSNPPAPSGSSDNTTSDGSWPSENVESPSSSYSSTSGSGSRWYTEYDRSEALEVISMTDSAFRTLIEHNCSISDKHYPSAAGLMNILVHVPSSAKVVSRIPKFRFFLSLDLAGTSFPTPAMYNYYPEDKIRAMIQSSIPNASDYELDVFVRVGDNLDLIADIKRQNEWVRQRLSGGSSSSSSSSSSFGFVGDASDAGGSFDGKLDEYGGYDRYREPSSSGDGMVGSDAGDRYHYYQHYHGDAGGYRLQPVPLPEYFVQIEFRNLTIAPRVLGVFIGEVGMVERSYESETTEAYVGFNTTPMQLDRFVYVPPPPDLDLVWHEPSNDTCTECIGLAIECAYDMDCIFGLKQYLATALKRVNATDFDSNWVNITSAFRTAQSYFPANGYKRLSKLVMCLATRWPPCELDYPREVRNVMTGAVTMAPPTHFVIDPAVVNFRVPMNSKVDFAANGWQWYQYWESGDASSFEDFMIYGPLDEQSKEDFYYKRGGAIFTYNMTWSEGDAGFGGSADNSSTTVGDGSNGNDGTATGSWPMIYHWVSMGYAIEDVPYIHPAEVLYSNPWSVFITADRSDDEEMVDGGPKLLWRRMTEWIYMVLGDSGSSGNGGSYGGSGSYGSNDGSGTEGDMSNHTTVIPASGNSICPECAQKLMDCLGDYQCRTGVRTTVVPSMISALSAQINRTEPQALSVNLTDDWNLWISNFDYGDGTSKFAELLGCLSSWGCAVGYSAESSRPGSPRVPSTISFSRESVINFNYNDRIISGFSLDWIVGDYMEQWWAEGMKDFLHQAYGLDTTAVKVYKFHYANDSLEYHVVYRKPMSRYPHFWDESHTVELSRTTLSLSLNVDANSVALALSGLLTWFNMEAPDGNATDSVFGNITSPFESWDPCMKCVDELQRCMTNALCREVTVNNFVPNVLTPPVAFENMRMYFWGGYETPDYGGTSYIYRSDVTDVLGEMNSELTDEESWFAFKSMFTCMALEACDLRYMDDAVAVPATAHAPTNFVFSPGGLGLRTYPGTQVTVIFNGMDFTYTRSADIEQETDPFEFARWFEGVLGPDIPIDWTYVKVEGEFREAFTYNGLFGVYLGELPNFSVTKTVASDWEPYGYTYPWKINVRSVEVVPAWPKLVDLLSFVANTTTSDGLSCVACEELRSRCRSNSWTQYVIKTNLVTSLKEANYYWGTEASPTTFDFTSSFIWTVLSNLDSDSSRDDVLLLLKCFDADTGPGAACVKESSEMALPGVSTDALVVAHGPYSELKLPIAVVDNLQVTYYLNSMATDSQYFDYYGNIDEIIGWISGLDTYCGLPTVTMTTAEETQLYVLRINYNCYYGNMASMEFPIFKVSDPMNLETPATPSVDYAANFSLHSTASPLGAPFASWIQWFVI